MSLEVLLPSVLTVAGSWVFWLIKLLGWMNQPKLMRCRPKAFLKSIKLLKVPICKMVVLRYLPSRHHFGGFAEIVPCPDLVTLSGKEQDWPSLPPPSRAVWGANGCKVLLVGSRKVVKAKAMAWWAEPLGSQLHLPFSLLSQPTFNKQSGTDDMNLEGLRLILDSELTRRY